VQKWEHNLNLIADVLTEWMAVQRKWLYLEGIFIGGDIRTQLPEEARKFDAIDAAYRRVRRFSFTSMYHGSIGIVQKNQI